tara:strand:+ start:4669 stop:4860 length:192 start_codon:yes stop_codon:yes gene_type:complete
VAKLLIHGKQKFNNNLFLGYPKSESAIVLFVHISSKNIVPQQHPSHATFRFNIDGNGEYFGNS